MTSEFDDRLSRLQQALSGTWEYRCEAASPSLYEGGETARGGIMQIRASVDPVGLVVDIRAHRLWVERISEDGTVLKEALTPPTPWQADGGVVMMAGQLWFKYAARDGSVGWTTDSFLLSDDTFEFSEGEFEHIGESGEEVRGKVRLLRVIDPAKLQLAPDGVSADEVLVDVSTASV